MAQVAAFQIDQSIEIKEVRYVRVNHHKYYIIKTGLPLFQEDQLLYSSDSDFTTPSACGHAFSKKSLYSATMSTLTFSRVPPFSSFSS